VFETAVGTITQAQVVALSCAACVVAFLLAANVAVCHLYRRATTEHVRRDKRQRKKRESDVWVYHVYRSENEVLFFTINKHT
jgi:hypothetical protein